MPEKYYHVMIISVAKDRVAMDTSPEDNHEKEKRLRNQISGYFILLQKFNILGDHGVFQLK